MTMSNFEDADDDHRKDGHVKPVDTTPATCKEKGENFTRPTRLRLPEQP